jgi:hypothetical protein
LENWKQIWRNIAYELTCDELSAFRKALADDAARQELLAEVERALDCRFELMAQVAGSILASSPCPERTCDMAAIVLIAVAGSLGYFAAIFAALAAGHSLAVARRR